MAKKNKRWEKAAVAALLFIALAYVIVYYHKPLTRYCYKIYRVYKRHHRKSAKDSFQAINFPAGFAIHGIDISHYQEDFNWDNLRTKTTDGDTVDFSFAFMKATEGPWREDPAFAGNWEDAHDHHIYCGAYHYFLADKDAKRQADNFISSVNLHEGDLPPVIDIEDTRGKSKQEIVDGVKTMSRLLELKYGSKPIIYSNINFIEDYLSDDFPDHYFWVAHFYEEELEVSDEIHWLFWQHNDKAMMLGYDQKVDVNVFNGNTIELRNILIHEGPRIRPNPE
ncbi:MAG: glycoside hydrolase [Bacteroidetes bacterium]|nr:glycoside hydrolase [Bacteroidota bacterium]